MKKILMVLLLLSVLLLLGCSSSGYDSCMYDCKEAFCINEHNSYINNVNDNGHDYFSCKQNKTLDCIDKCKGVSS